MRDFTGLRLIFSRGLAVSQSLRMSLAFEPFSSLGWSVDDDGSIGAVGHVPIANATAVLLDLTVACDNIFATRHDPMILVSSKLGTVTEFRFKLTALNVAIRIKAGVD